MIALVELALIFAGIVFLMSRKWNLGLVLLLASVAVGLLFGRSVIHIGRDILLTTVDPLTLRLIFAIALIITLGELLRKTAGLKGMVEALEALIPNRRVVVLHSGLTAAQRHHQWATAADGAAHIVMGARSAIFAPVPDGKLGLVIVDEEHDGSYKQDQVPRYHGRDVAVRRGQLAGVPVVLGSATPSLESTHAAAEGRYDRLVLPERVGGGAMPATEIVDMRKEKVDRKRAMLGDRLIEELDGTLGRGEQAILFLNRRGYATQMLCTKFASMRSPPSVCATSGWNLTP